MFDDRENVASAVSIFSPGLYNGAGVSQYSKWFRAGKTRNCGSTLNRGKRLSHIQSA